MALLLWAAAFSAAWGRCLSSEPLRGVNMAGAEFNSKVMPGRVFKDYVYPSRTDLQYFADAGANTIRLPFRWERLQPSLDGPLDRNELQQIAQVAKVGRELGLCVILDAHNYGTYAGQPLGSAAVPANALAHFWVLVHRALNDPEHIAFGLMNEPAKIPLRLWADVAQQTLLALRDAGSKHLVLVAGGMWSGAHDWMKPHDGLSNADAFASLRDPLQRSFIEVHQYADAQFSGTQPDCIPATRMTAIFQRITLWARAHGQRLFLGEFGVAPVPECLATLKAQLQAMRDPVWAGWAYWAAGAWWGRSYPFSIHPVAGLDRLQLRLLRDEW
jgi:endoglucanase